MNEELIQRAVLLLQQEFGPNWQSIAQTLGTENLRKRLGKELTSFMAFPDRGNGGDNQWRGNCSPQVVSSILRYVIDCKKYYGKDVSDFTLLDPMSGSGTSKAAADLLGVRSILYDLNPNPAAGLGNWNALKDDVEDSADLVFSTRRITISFPIPETCGESHMQMIYPGVKTMMISWRS